MATVRRWDQPVAVITPVIYGFASETNLVSRSHGRQRVIRPTPAGNTLCRGSDPVTITYIGTMRTVTLSEKAPPLSKDLATHLW